MKFFGVVSMRLMWFGVSFFSLGWISGLVSVMMYGCGICFGARSIWFVCFFFFFFKRKWLWDCVSVDLRWWNYTSNQKLYACFTMTSEKISSFSLSPSLIYFYRCLGVLREIKFIGVIFVNHWKKMVFGIWWVKFGLKFLGIVLCIIREKRVLGVWCALVFPSQLVGFVDYGCGICLVVIFLGYLIVWVAGESVVRLGPCLFSVVKLYMWQKI